MKPAQMMHTTTFGNRPSISDAPLLRFMPKMPAVTAPNPIHTWATETPNSHLRYFVFKTLIEDSMKRAASSMLAFISSASAMTSCTLCTHLSRNSSKLHFVWPKVLPMAPGTLDVLAKLEPMLPPPPQQPLLPMPVGMDDWAPASVRITESPASVRMTESPGSVVRKEKLPLDLRLTIKRCWCSASVSTRSCKHVDNGFTCSINFESAFLRG
mmetsp:Transcript_74753/g.214116  ORF Transcript_74753/g.214116 Transcript_74753/m.214116 type:complete len:212 (+) Transcript_74753:532-1167(+)